ncbi:hypothetical protein GGQ97_001562 [Sphingomonas kaistensis]|uniref:ARG and Rhodanese-Phosphatase-superfamily-associated domain-containing protein n=1 Tax=Sphingomonas kaistensis TaxID=298708 RepID=A0A7X6BFU5_9SPHN|nr:DUF6569 family protein [Sphingomonas kaistensis]NJC05769.1 hypothetical protein [Sphingomonas kaistensis]
MYAITKLLDQVELGTPLTAGAVFMFPIFGQTVFSDDLMVLDEALNEGAVEITEISDDGFVPELLVRNAADRSLFLLDGEQVVGLKQNRTFNLSMLLPAKSSTVVPVSCLERGRWDVQSSRAMAAEHVHFAKGRASKMRSVGQSLATARAYSSDQGRVWADIDEKFAERGSRSSTYAEADYYMERRAELEPPAIEFEPQAGQTGAAYGVGKRIVGADLFGSPSLFHSLGRKLSRSYLMETIGAETLAAPPSTADALKTLKALLSTPVMAFPAPGEGETLRLEADGLTGAALVKNGRCIHVAVLCDP